MSFVNLSVENFKEYKYSDNKHKLCSGRINIEVEEAKKIIIPAKVKEDSHIVFQNSKLDEKFKMEILNFPITKETITLYDHSSLVINRYTSFRENNNPGNLKNLLSRCKFLQEIKLPTIEGKINLVIDNYLPIKEITLKDSIEHLIKEDFKMFQKNNEHISSKNIRLFITPPVFTILNEYINLEDIFLDVISNDFITSSLLEYICGKQLGSSDISNQEHISFLNNVNIISVLSPNLLSSKIIGRGENVLQINVYEKKAEINFICLLDQRNLYEEKLKLAYNDSIYEAVDISNLSDEDLSQVNTLKNNILFLEIINRVIKRNQSFINFVKTNPLEVINYLYNTESYKNKENNSLFNLIANFNKKIFEKIHHLLKERIFLNTQLESKLPVLGFQEVEEDYMLTPSLGRQYTCYNN